MTLKNISWDDIPIIENEVPTNNNMINNQPPSNCPACQSPVKHIPEGISKKTGKKYREFWACENRNCNFTWNKPEEKPQQQTTKDQIIMNELLEINKKLDSLSNNIENVLKELGH